jgi:Sigma-70 factor, region 1.
VRLVAADDRYTRFQQLIEAGREKGYILYDDLSEVLPEESQGGPELDDLLAGLDAAGVDLLEEPKLEALKKEDELEEGAEAELAGDTGDKTNDPVRMYLREMGTVALLTREGEIELARRIEHGHRQVVRVLTRSPFVMREIVELADEARSDPQVMSDFLIVPETPAEDEDGDPNVDAFLRVVDRDR